MLRLRPLAVILSLALGLCLLGLWHARSQTAVPRRVTNTTNEGLNLNPSLSGNGRRIAFESTEDVAGAGGGAFFRAIRADITRTPSAFVQFAGARAPAPGISQDGSVIAFAAKDDPLGTNADGNSEIFLYNGTTLRQITTTTPNDITRRASDGNFQPSLSDDGRFIAFSSNRNLTGQNSDGNFEIFVYDATANSFSQLTNTAGGYGSTDAKLSGDGSRVAYIKDSSTLPAVQRDLMLQDRTGGVTRLIADNVTHLALTFGRAISDDGARVVFAGDTAADSSQVFLYDARTNSARAVTALDARATEVPLHPTISGDGSRIAFATRRTVPQLGGNGDHSIELYTLDIPTGQFAAVTDAPSEADGYQGSTRVAEVVSSLSDDGSLVAFNFPRALSGEVETGLENNSEIYVSGTAPRPSTGTLEILNGASFGHEPSTEEAVAPESYAVATGGALAFETEEAEKQSDGTYPTTLAGSTVTVNGIRAQIVSISPTRVDFLVPAGTAIGTATVVVTNEEGFRSIGTVEVKTGAPGIFTESGDGTGEGEIVNAQTRAPGPFDPTGGELRLLIFTTGVRNASEVTARAGGHTLTVESVTESTTRPGTDEVRVRVPAELRGAGTVDLFVRADDRDSNPVTLTFLGVAPRPDIVINEVLADPPADDAATAAVEGDSNRDGVRDTSDDEFVELVNASGRDLNISGYQLFSRSTTGAEDNLRHTFAPGTILPAGTAVVVFGGGNVNPKNAAFGGALVFKASEGELTLVNGGGTVTLRDASANLVTNFSWGGSTGLEGDEDQSLTRSPEITGSFTLHTTATGSNGKPYSPGTRANGQPFTAPAIARIEVTPSSASIAIGQTQQFTARAFDANGNEMAGVIFTWESSAPAVATIDENGLATGKSEGTAEIRARARGQASAPATVTVRFVPRVLTSVEVTPSTSTIPVGGQQQFTARGLDQFGNAMDGLTFTWESTDTSVATVDQDGLATGLGIGTSVVKASTGGKTGTATLNVTAPRIVINEALADPPGSEDTDLAGDANRDGERDASQDEFVELVNSSSAAVDISGWTISTRTLDDATTTLRHTFAAGTTVPAGSAIVVFGGGTENFDPSNPAFGCAQVVKASSGRLSFLNSGETIVVADANGNLTAQLTYGSDAGLNGGANQSMTRSPDITGDFVLHGSAADSSGRVFSPGVKVDGTPFGNCPARLASVNISPTSQSVIVGRTTQFTAQARDQFGRPMKGVTLTFVSDNTNVATVDSVTTNSSTGIATATVRGRTVGTAHITARATSNGTTVSSDPATLNVTPPPPRVTRIEVTPSTAAINRGGTQKFTAKAFNGTTQVTAGVNVTWTSSDTNVATVDQNGLAQGAGFGTVTITATAPDGLGGTVSDTAQLTVRVPLVINELLADVPTDNAATQAVEGDSNRDGVRSSGDDEFIELLNNTNQPVDISGVIIADGTSNRFTIPAGTILAAGRALVIFGGGEPPADDPAFGGALVIRIPGSLSLNDSGDTVFVKLPVGGTEVVIASESYGDAGGVAKANDQSLTRSPDAATGTTGGALVPHTTATNADGRLFSPGTRTDGTPFGSPAITRIQVTPLSATVDVGGSRAFTARAFSNASGTEVEVLNVSFIWDASDPAKAEVAPKTGRTTTATAQVGGSTLIRARAGGKLGAGTLNVNFPPVSRIEVTPETATIPVGGQQQFTARAFDASNHEIAGAPFTWSSSNTNVATIDSSGLATGVGIGTTTIKATAGGKSGTATLTVVARTITINEVLADPPEGAAGDANRDGVRDSSDDELVELVNALNTSVNVSGWTLRTRSLSGTAETVRHTFADGTTLAAGKAVVIFGGGTINAADPAFGGSQVVKASTGRLSLTNSGLQIILRNASGNVVTQFTYGSTGLNGDKDQSLTRSPDITGDFAPHTTATNADGRVVSPGTRTDGTPFGSPVITRIQVSPATATLNVGGTRVYTARAYSNASGTEVEIQNVSFIWDSSDPNRATVSPLTGRTTTATAHAGGSVTIRARAGGQAGAATLTINFPPVSRIEVTPATATIPVSGQQQFTARAFDASNNEIPGFTFTWSSSNTNVATIDANGLATGVSTGTTTIKASGGGKSGTATLTVVARTVTINEILADPPDGLAGDANRDGVRDSSDDEFVELVNALNSSVNVSGWTLRTRSLTGSTETVRHTFAAGTTLAAGKAVVIFGGGSPNQSDPAFGGAQVLTASSGRLSLTNSGLHILLRDSSGNLVAQLTYGSDANLDADKDQSLTRSPDITGDFGLHTQAPNSDGRLFSPGTRVDGTPFGSPAITRIEVSPATATVNVGGMRSYTARAYSNTGGPEVEVLNVSFIWDSSNPNVAAVSPQTGRSTTATANAGGSATIRARAGGQAGAGTLNVNFPPVSRIEVTPETATIPVGGTQQFTARAFDASNNEITGLTFTWTSSNQSAATVDSSGVATGVGTGTTTIKAGAGGKNDTSSLTVVARTITINEVLADPPEGLAGDANRDGVRDSSDDEFVELVNALNSSVNVAGWTIRTRSLSGTTETLRHTFADGTTLAAGKAVVIFGGGTINSADPAFGGSQVVKASTGRLSLTNSGLTIVVRDASGNLVAQLTYGGSTGLDADQDQSLTRSPDITGDFALHTAAANAAGRVFSPGTRTDGTPFGSPVITRIEVSPASATVNIGAKKVYTARAYSNAGGPEVEVLNVSFIWDSSNPNVAGLSPATGRTTTATALSGGSTTVRAQAGGLSGAGVLNVNFPPISRIEVTPETATIPVGGTQQFTARAFDASNNEIPGITFTWTSTNTSVATVDSSGVATGLAVGTTTIKAAAGGKNDTAALTVVARTVTINEILADPPDGLAGDANRDGVRDSTDDEFIELVNALNSSVDISGWTIRTRSLSGTTETVRHTFDPGTTLPAGQAIVVFGGGTLTPADPAFGGAQVVTTSTSGLSLTNSGVHLIVRDSSGNVVAQLTYGSAAGLNGDSNQSLTRSPDITGDFALHTTAANSDGRKFSPGTRLDGTPFGSPPITRIEITPASSSVYPGDAQLFTARAYSNTGGPEVEVLNVSFVWDSSDTNVATVSPATGRTTTGTAVAPGTATIRARAGGQADTSDLTVNAVVASVELEPASASVPATATRTFTATARDSNGNVIPGITFTFSLRDASPANAATITGTTSNTVTVRGDNQGSVTVVAGYTRPNDNVTLEDTSALTITAPPPRVTSVEVSPDTATINRGQTQQFTVTAFNGATPVSGVTYTWTSSDTAVATVDQNGLATGLGIGTTTITVTAPDGLGGTVSDTATLNVQVPLVINEILADPPAGTTGDSNRDGTTNTDDDEFLELVNNSNAPVDVSGVVVSDSVSNRFTFPAGTTLAANQAALIFGGGSPNASDPNFGGALIFTTTSLGLNNTGDTVSVKLNVGGTNVVVATETYGSNAGNDQSLTRSPDLTGAFEHHTTATNSNGRLFSPGTRLDGTPFGSPAITRIEVTPASSSVYPGDTQQFTAKAFSNVGGPEVEIQNVSFYWTSSATAVATVSPTVGQGTTATALTAGTSNISAHAGGQAGTAALTVNPVVASIELAPATASVPVGSSQVFTATARDSGGNVITGLTFTFSLRDASPANAATITGTTSNTVTVRGDNEGTVTVVVNYTRPNDGVTLEDTSAVTVTPAPPQVDHVEVTPSTATVNRGQTQQFTATAFDSSNQAIPGVTFTWTSSNTNVATVDASGLATGVGIGTTTITAETPDGQGGTASGTATLNVQVPLVINEILADVALDSAGTTDIVEGDANRDGVRSADDDEFVELLNNSNAPVDLSGVVISDTTSNRFTFPSGTTLAAGRAVVIFGGGTPPTSDPAFGGSLILTTSSLGLNDTGDTVTVKLNVGGSDVQIDQVAYGGANPAPAPSDQSLTRSPDAEIGTTGGSFVAHNAATNAHNRVFSPGTRADGTPFGSPAITRIEVTPAAPAIDIGETQQFTGKAFSNLGGPEVEVLNVSFFWTSSNTSVATVAPLTGQTTTATAHTSGSSTITAFAGGQNGTAALTVNAPPPSLSVGDVSMTEGDAGTKSFVFTVQLDGPAPTGGVTFDIETADNTATDADNDYDPNSATAVTIPAMQTSTTFTVLVNGDPTIEPDETFFVNVTNVSGATVSDNQGVGTIQNDDSPSLSINDVAASEGDAGTTTFTFTVHSSVPAPAGGITFDISTADGTAHDDVPPTEDNDYVAKSLTTQTIAEGNQDYTFDVTANGDTLVEPDETFTVNVTNVTGATVSDGQGVGTIQNDDAADLVISQVYPGGGNAGATYTHDFIELFNQGTTTIDFSATPYSVQYAGATANFGAANTKTDITSGTVAPGHYFLIEEASGGANGVALPSPDLLGGNIALSATAGKVALVLGTAAVTATSCPGDDGTPPLNPSGSNIVDFVGYGSTAACYEGSGPAPFSTSTAGGLDPDARSVVRKSGGCQDTNDNAADFLNPVSAPVARNTMSATNSCVAGAAPNLTINDVTAAEGNSGTTTFTFTVSLSAPAPSTDIFFDIATQNDTATAGSDYVSRSLTNQVIPAGQQTYTFNVTVNGDTTSEPDETFFVNVTNVSGATLTDGQGVGTIQNDEVPALSINDVSMSEGGTGGTTTFSFTVHLSSPALAGGVQFDISTADNTATDADNDYEPRSLTSQTIAAGAQDYTFDVTVNGDAAVEANETFFVNVSSVTGATVTDAQGLGTIQNDDSPVLSINDVTAAEGNSGTQTYTFTVHLSQPAPAGGVSFDIATQNNTAVVDDGNPATIFDNDYVGKSLTGQTIPEATQDYQFTVTVNGDTVVEPNESFFVNVTNVSGATVSDGQGLGTIQNDDVADLVISQVYPGGGNAGATYTNDFIELFNQGTTTVDFSVTNYSVQYAGATANFGAANTKTDIITGTIGPGQYFLIQEATGGANGVALPTPDATGNIALSATAGKVMLVLGTTAFTGTTCPGDDGTPPLNPNNVNIVDFVGYGTTANCYEGSGPAPFSTSTAGGLDPDARSTIRTPSCTDTNNNATDFTNPTTAPTARNKSTPAAPCP